ncbi:hypothetical protein EYF80_005738 [Liparis tanakae]|uniref:Uncharacterized protein n=1 Tax=Liparis tanakae TaxID=230148 RepID=A0A4Z2J1H6_9TELE|nr:hypothetical protein EYF80_005738 [Liparis tanakae]
MPASRERCRRGRFRVEILASDSQTGRITAKKAAKRALKGLSNRGRGIRGNVAPRQSRGPPVAPGRDSVTALGGAALWELVDYL